MKDVGNLGETPKKPQMWGQGLLLPQVLGFSRKFGAEASKLVGRGRTLTPKIRIPAELPFRPAGIDMAHCQLAKARRRLGPAPEAEPSCSSCASPNADKDAASAGAAHRERLARLQARQGEVRAIHEPFASNQGFFEDRHDGPLGPAAKSVQASDSSRCRLPRPPGLGIETVPVVEPERDVAVLLHLKEDETATEGVNGAGRQEEAVARLRMEDAEAVGDGAVGGGSAKVVGTEAGLEADIDAALRLGVQDDPGFGFAALTGRQEMNVAVVGMDLDRERVAGIEELEQEREGAWQGGRSAAAPCVA